MKYSKSLKIIRAVKELEQQELAEILGVDKSLISRIEKDSRSLSEELKRKIEKKLNIPVMLIDFLALQSEDLNGLEEKDVKYIGKEFLKILNR